MNKQQSIGQYIFEKTLGQGTFGKVKLATHQITQEKVAIKILEKSKIVDASDVERVQREIQILKTIRHPNLVQLYEIISTQKQLFLIMEYVNGGELFDYIVQNQRLRDAEAARLFFQLVQGIEYLHKLKIVHRDIKPENLMLENKQRIKIIDFGLSNIYPNGDQLKTACGSPCYAAPEMIAGKRYHGLNADIWSAGIVLFAMLAGHLPFEEPNTNLLYKKILAGEYKFPNNISLPARNLIAGILQTDPTKRFTINDIRKHPWMTNNVKSPIQQGIIIGQHKIPVDFEILKQLVKMGYLQEYAQKCIENNSHNSVTTIYYLLLKKHIQNGGKSFADIGSENFSPLPQLPQSNSISDHNNNNAKAAKPLPIIRPKLPEESPINFRNRNMNLSLHSQQNTSINQTQKVYSVDSKRQNGNQALDLQQTLREPQYNKMISPAVRPRGISDYACRFGPHQYDNSRQKSVDYSQNYPSNQAYFMDTRFKTFYRIQ